jgi:hypothetical protein
VLLSAGAAGGRGGSSSSSDGLRGAHPPPLRCSTRTSKPHISK